MADTPTKINLRIRGMHCAGCVSTVEQAIRRVPGVESASVQLMNESAVATVSRSDVAPAQLIAAVRQAGYDAEVTTSPAELAARLASDSDLKEKLRRHRQEIIQALMYALPVLALDHVHHTLWPDAPHSQIAARLMQFILLIMLMSTAGAPIMVGGLRALIHRAANMDLLIALGVIVALISSVYGTFIAHDDAFVHIHAAAMILTLVIIGRYLETRARSRATAAMASLVRRIPKTALVQVGDTFVEKAFEDIHTGDILRIRSGGAIPTDGEIIEGQAAIDESLMTGESMPQTRRSGDKVLGGTVIVEGSLLVRATASTDRSALGRILQLVAQSQSGRTQMQRTADRLAAIFTPVIIMLAIATFLGWLLVGGRTALADATRSTVAVLVVACPCALGLATPVVVVVAAGVAALRGILVRDAAMLEAMGHVDTVVWDKTGTLTSGMPTVGGTRTFTAMDERTVLSLAAGAETLSTHPIAKSIEAYARRIGVSAITPSEGQVVAGQGVIATVNGHRVLIGNAQLLDQQGIGATAATSPNESNVHIAIDGVLSAAITIIDIVRPSSAQAVARLTALNIRSELLTGDTESAARNVANEIGIIEITAAASPTDKVEHIKHLRAAGYRVAMVGDGINDAAALSAADVGIAFATGADVACEAAGINLIGSTPHLVADAVELSRAAVRIIRQNLFWAFFYNVLMIPLAALGRLPPSLAAGAMMISSLTVVLNALRLRLRNIAE